MYYQKAISLHVLFLLWLPLDSVQDVSINAALIETKTVRGSETF